MNNYLIYKITYTFHSLGFYYYSVKYYLKDNYKKTKNIFVNIFSFLWIFLKGIVKESKIFIHHFGHYEYLEIPITTRCNLRCKGCSNLMPCYKKADDIDLDILYKSIDNFLDCINNIVYIRVLGGEPFLSKNLEPVLVKLLESKKIQRIEIVTNGSIVPTDKKLLKILKNNKIIISISRYPIIDTDKLLSVLDKNGITYRVDKINFWLDYGDMHKRNKKISSLKTQFRRCNHVCKSMLKGELHLCPRSGHGKDLGILKNIDDDYLNFLIDMDPKERRKKLNKLLRKRYITACDYCDFATSESKKIGVAEQMRGRRNEKNNEN